MINNKYFKKLTIVLVIIILVPIILFVINFYNQIFSNKISDWGAFGDYFGGVINPIISILSLIILAYITYILSSNSIEENKKLFIYQKKVEAYDKFISFTPILNRSYEDLVYEIKLINAKVDIQFKQDITIEMEIIGLKNIADKFAQLAFFTMNFAARYDHFFQFEFDIPEYNRLVELAIKFKKVHYEVFESFLNMESVIKIEDMSTEYQEMINNFVTILNRIKAEIEIS